MLFRQLFEAQTCTYTYIIASDFGREAIIIDPVKEKTSDYLQILQQLDLKLVYGLDTHTHADHVTALGALRDNTSCVTVMGDCSQAECVSMYLKDDESITVDGLTLRGIYTPGHTNESFSFHLEHDEGDMIFTGDVLLIRGTGRTDFQSGNPIESYNSINERIFTLNENTFVYPGHDYKGWTVSTIKEEKQFNPRLAGKSLEQYIEIMNNLNLPDPKMMDEAIPANLACGNL